MDTNPAPLAGSRFWLILLLVGLVGGLLSGLFGIGGGIVMVPLLVGLARFDQRRAAATSLAAIVPTSIVGSFTYFANGEIDFVAGAFIAVGAITGSLIGTKLLRRLPIVWLRWLFIALIVGIAVRLLLVTPVRGEELELTVPVAIGYVALGLFMGVASGLFGVGGGVIAVPSLISLFGVSDLIAKGTSLLVMIPTGIVGTLSNVRARLVDVRAGLVIGLAATAASVPGVALALIIPPRLSTILFVALLTLIVVQLVTVAVRAQRKGK